MLYLSRSASRARLREAENARRLFPRGTGLVGLFGGPPGTGKTMSAQVIAADLLVRDPAAQAEGARVSEGAYPQAAAALAIFELQHIVWFG